MIKIAAKKNEKGSGREEKERKKKRGKNFQHGPIT